MPFLRAGGLISSSLGLFQAAEFYKFLCFLTRRLKFNICFSTLQELSIVYW